MAYSNSINHAANKVSYLRQRNNSVIRLLGKVFMTFSYDVNMVVVVHVGITAVVKNLKIFVDVF